MKAQDLRIGNVVCFLGNPACPVVIDKARMHLILDGDDDYEPLPLTEEWLKKAGFQMWNDGYTYSIEFENGDTIQINKSEVFLGGPDACISGHGFTLDIQFVHQLQNLYFALRGQELEVTQLTPS